MRDECLICGAALAVVCFGKIMLVDRLLMGNYDITFAVDAVVCCLDSLNYVTDPEGYTRIVNTFYEKVLAK